MKRMTAFALGLLAATSLFADPIEFRGVVEGYYGRPWGTEGRLSLLKFMGENGMNVFIYGPKDDPYHHARWREMYPEKETADFKRLLAVAKKNKIHFYWAIHLGGTYQKGNEGDRAALYKKLGAMYDIGFRAFAVFFDDFGGSDAEFHADICNGVIRDFLEKKGDCAPLVVCPNVYWGTGSRYQDILGERLDPKAKIMWTGSWICSDIRAADVEKITKSLRRAPFIWWNWPVNDYCRKHVLLGRTYGIEPCKVSGFVSNPMENCEANKIALYGIAKWCLDPEHFDSKKTWEESFAKIYPDKEVAAAMRVFAEHNSDQGPNGHGYRREESVSAEPLANRTHEELKAGAVSEATRKELTTLFKRVGGASKLLMKKLPLDKGLGWELRGWLENEQFLMKQGLLALNEKDDHAFVTRLAKIRARSAQAVEEAKARFREATFDGDKPRMNPPEASARVLKPLVEALVLARLKPIYEKRFHRAFGALGGFVGFSNTKSMPRLTASRDGKYARLDAVLEQKEVRPGETFGLSVPESWQTDYFHAKLGNAQAASAGVIEVSKDGKTWEKLSVRVHGEEMETALKVEDGYRHARYRNASSSPVTVKLNLFKFDVRGEYSPLDGMVQELAESLAK